jgi:hypothetical protein
MSPDQRQRYAERAIRLHELVRYRQAFVVLRITEFVAWEPRFLASARALVNRHRQLLARR